MVFGGIILFIMGVVGLVYGINQNNSTQAQLESIINSGSQNPGTLFIVFASIAMAIGIALFVYGLARERKHGTVEYVPRHYNSTHSLVLTAMFFAIGLVLPFVTGQIPQIGQMLLPMHIPVLLCSLMVGWQYGLAIGFLLPITRSLLFSMPALYPNAVGMMFELAAYGFFAGFLYRLFLKLKWNSVVALFASLILAMIFGRIVWGAASLVLYNLKGNAFTWPMFIGGAFLNAIPGIVLQIVAVPAIVLALNKVMDKN